MPRSNELFDEIAQHAKTVKMRATSDELFDEIDTDKNGTIEDHELLLHCVDKGMPEGAIAQLFQKLDVESDGHISREEWTEGFSLYEFASQHTSPPATRGGRGSTCSLSVYIEGDIEDDDCNYEGERNAAAQREGRGTAKWPDGSKYEGNWYENKQHGRGTYTFADGCTYKGMFKAGIKEGRGTYTAVDGRLQMGTYRDMSMVGTSVQLSADRTQAWKLLDMDGKNQAEISLEEAREIAGRIGLPYPGPPTYAPASAPVR